MRKQFFYAALAIAMMSSCSKDNDPGANNLGGTTGPEEIVDEGAPVAIEFGIGAPTVNASTRGTGFAGNATETDPAYWDEQDLNLLMTRKGSLVLATEDPDDATSPYVFAGIQFKAPKVTVTDETKMIITNATGKVAYYPLKYACDFYGFHFDDATATPATATPPVTTTDTQSISYDLEIDGTQDIMIAKAELTDAQGTTLDGETTVTAPRDRAYSSWAARRGIQPIMKFKHLLSRLDFVAKVGAEVADGENIATTTTVDGTAYTTAYTAENGYPQPAQDGTIPNGVYVKSIKVVNPNNKITVVVADLTETADTPQRGIKAKSTTGTTEAPVYFNLQRKKTSEELAGEGANKKVIPFAPITAGTAKDAISKIGDGIMIVPGEKTFDMEIELMQYVKVFDKELGATEDIYEWKSSKILTTVTLPEGTTAFEAGKYYTITVTIYGFSRIEVTANLTKWEEGGNVSSNPEDDAFN